MGICFSVLFVLGMILFIASAVSLGGFSIYDKLGINNVKSVIIFALCLGLFIALVSIFGALGYFTLTKWMLIVFVVLIAILIALQIVCGATAFAYKSKFGEIANNTWYYLIEKGDNETLKFLEDSFHCCGGHNRSDFFVKSSFCDDNSTSESIGSGSDIGCIEVIAQDLSDNIDGVCIGDIVITVLEIVVIVVTAFVLHEVRNANSYTQFQGESPLDSIKD